jgi:hypothetical protein
MKCPRCSHEWDPRGASVREARREIEDREIDRQLGIDEFGGFRGVLPGKTFVGKTGGSDDWDEEEIIRDR